MDPIRMTKLFSNAAPLFISGKSTSYEKLTQCVSEWHSFHNFSSRGHLDFNLIVFFAVYIVQIQQGSDWLKLKNTIEKEFKCKLDFESEEYHEAYRKVGNSIVGFEHINLRILNTDDIPLKEALLEVCKRRTTFFGCTEDLTDTAKLFLKDFSEQKGY